MTIHASMLKVDTRRTISAHDDLELQIRVSWQKKGREKFKQTLSYHRFVQVPTCSPSCRLYVPQRKLLHSSARPCGLASSKHTTNRALSTISRHDLLCLSEASECRNPDQILRFSVDRTPMAPRATSEIGTLSASLRIAWRLRSTSRSVRIGSEDSSRTSNQS